MTNQQILTNAIQKAIDGGWEALPINGRSHWIESTPEHRAKEVAMMLTMGSKVQSEPYRSIIFNHDFAKALWGYKFINPEMRDDTGSKVIAIKRTAWKFHLQQMVIANDPIEYLGEHL